MRSQGSSDELGFWRKVGYGLGDIYGGGSGVVVSFYYLYFLTDVILLNPALAGTVILISKVYDAITDPFEGVLSDRTRTRLGRRRPYLLAGIPLVFFSFVLLFYPLDLDLELHRFLYVLCTYLFFSTVVSIVMLNYNALQSEMTLDYNERTSLSSARILFSTIGSIVCAVLPLEIVKLFPDVRSGFVAMGLVIGIFFALPFLATYISVRERPDFQRPPEPFSWRRTFVEPLTNRTFVYTLMLYLLAFVAIDAVASIVIYFMKYYLERGGEANYVTGTLLVAQVISLPFYVWLSKRTSKTTGYIVGAMICIGAVLASFFVTVDSPGYAIYLLAAVVGLGTGGIVVMIYAIFPDIPDVDELKSGERREGIYSAMFTFMRKLSSALALFLVGFSISRAGYVQPVETIIDGVSQLVEQPQTRTFLTLLRMIFAVLPTVFLAIALAFAFRFPLTPQMHERLRGLLAARRAGEPETEEMHQEADDLTRQLIGRGAVS
jgi:oligogalacturonide transporter